MSRRHLDIPGSLRVDGRGPEHYTLANIHIGARLEVTPSVVVSTSYNINKLSSIRCSGGSSPSAGVTRACGATWQTRRSDIYNIYTSTYLQYLYIYNIYLHIYTGPLARRLSRLHREFLRLWCSGGRHGAAAREGARGLDPELNHWRRDAGGL